MRSKMRSGIEQSDYLVWGVTRERERERERER